MFFHNGLFHTLRQVIEFYVQRDTNPGNRIRATRDGSMRKFDDLPAAYHANVDAEPPFGGRPGDRPALSDDEIDDVVAFPADPDRRFFGGAVAAQPGGGNRAIQWRAMSSRRHTQTWLWARMCSINRISALARPGWPVRRMCKPTDIMRGRSAPSS